MKLSRPGLDSACLDWNYSELNWLRGIILGNCLTTTILHRTVGRNCQGWKCHGTAQKMGLPGPLEVLEAFGWKSKSQAPRAFKFCAKRVPIEVNNW